MALLAGPSSAASNELPVLPDGARLEATQFDRLPGWAGDDLGPAFDAFLTSCRALAAQEPSQRVGTPPSAALKSVCEQALLRAAPQSAAEIRTFFESAFVPYRVVPESGSGFLTAYYEPEVEGSLSPSRSFPVPLLARPADLVTFAPGEPRPPGIDEGLAAARRLPDGRFVPFADRAAIEDGALAAERLELVWLKDAVDLFMVHVQGSTRVRLPDGQVLRFTYAGRNGHPYTSIGKVIVSEGHMDLETMTLAKLTGWLRENKLAARRIMRLNRSYIFFARNDALPASSGPIGGSGVPLTPHRSIAIDRTIWSYGLPFFLDTTLPEPGGGERAVRRLMIAQDTGTAIVGPARADYFMGSGDEAGVRAGLVRHPMDFVVLWPVTR